MLARAAGPAGPPEFTAAALDHGQAVLIRGAEWGLHPTEHPDLWQLAPALTGPLPDPSEAGPALRQALLEATDRLVALDVARWRPEVADLLMNRQHREALPLPALPRRFAETAERAVLCLDLVELALDDEGGARTGSELTARQEILTDLHRAARRALVSVCSTQVQDPGRDR